MAKVLVGKIAHFYDKIGVAVIELDAALKEGDKIAIEDKEGNAFEQAVKSMQIEHEEIKSAKKGMAIGMKVEQPVKAGYKVFKV